MSRNVEIWGIISRIKFGMLIFFCKERKFVKENEGSFWSIHEYFIFDMKSLKLSNYFTVVC
jgi:hypothetical protein